MPYAPGMEASAVPSGRAGIGRTLFWLTVFGIGFGWVEASVVIYLRRIYYPAGFSFPLVLPDLELLKVELVRETATLVMLAAVAALAERRAWARFGAFSLLFGVWDLVYYLGLKAAVGWPPSLMTWDVLFLVPVIWVGPVLAPVLVAASLVVAGALIVLRVREGVRPDTGPWTWVLALVSLVLLLYSFMINHPAVRSSGFPGPFPWLPYLLGLALGWVGFVRAFYGRRVEQPSSG